MINLPDMFLQSERNDKEEILYWKLLFRNRNGEFILIHTDPDIHELNVMGQKIIDIFLGLNEEVN